MQKAKTPHKMLEIVTQRSILLINFLMFINESILEKVLYTEK